MRSMQPKLSKVKYLHSADIEELNRQLQTKIRTGWEPMGPIAFLNNEYVQQIFKVKFALVITPDLPPETPEGAVENKDLSKFEPVKEIK